MKEFMKQSGKQDSLVDILAVWDFCQRVFRFRCNICDEPFNIEVLFDVIYDNHMSSHQGSGMYKVPKLCLCAPMHLLMQILDKKNRE